jgi:hypothetical protein
VTRFKSAFKFALPLAVLLATSALSLTSTSVRAEWTDVGQNEDGSATLYYNDSTGSWAVVIEKDGRYGVYIDDAVAAAMLEKLGYGHSNPNPDDPNNGKGTEKPSAEAIKKMIKDAAAVVHNTPIGSKLGGIIEQHGGGKAPHWNPSDDDNKGPSNPPSSKDRIDMSAELKARIQKALDLAAKQAATGKQGMFDGSEGGTESWVGLNMHGKNNDPNDGDNSPDKPDIPKGEDLGPKPELVNPNPELKGPATVKVKTAKLGTATAKKQNLGASDTKNKGEGKAADKAAGKTVDKTAGVLKSPGLLDMGGGFAAGAPAASGMGAMPAGGAHTTRLR